MPQLVKSYFETVSDSYTIIRINAPANNAGQ